MPSAASAVAGVDFSYSVRYTPDSMCTVRKLWENSNITELFPKLAETARFDEPMSAHTTFKIGGPADFIVAPANFAELAACLRLFFDGGVPVSLIGGGSNLLVSDKGIRGAVISLAAFTAISRLPCDAAAPNEGSEAGRVLVRAEAGASMVDLTEWCASESLSGVERFAGLPGTVGGAVFMNARCYERSVSDVFRFAKVLSVSANGFQIVEKKFDSAEWGYKVSPFQARTGIDPLILGPGSTVVLAATFALSSGNEASIRAEMTGYARDREEKGHFRFPSGGSMFKNDRSFGKPSGKLIDEAGLRGFRIGDAQVAPWHGNFVINAGSARAADVRALVAAVKKRVFEATGFSMECEVIFAGDWSTDAAGE